MELTKASLRRHYLALRKQLTAQAIEEKSRSIAINLAAYLNGKKNLCIHTFLPIRGKGEVDTYLIIEHLKGKGFIDQVVVPRISDDQLSLVHFLFIGSQHLEYSAWGIAEPLPDPSLRIDPQEIDLVIVPLLAHDTKGFRVGYGKGYYDRFLAECRSDILKIGVSFYPPVPEIKDKDPWDVALDAVILP